MRLDGEVGKREGGEERLGIGKSGRNEARGESEVGQREEVEKVLVMLSRSLVGLGQNGKKRRMG